MEGEKLQGQSPLIKLKLKMFRRKLKPKRTDSCRSLIENNNNQEACDGYDNSLAQSSINIDREQLSHNVVAITLRDLAAVLGVDLDVDISMNEAFQEATSEHKKKIILIQRSVFKNFPKPPGDLNKDLPQHLDNVQMSMHEEFLKLAPLLENMELNDCLIDCYNRKLCDHISDLLQCVTSVRGSFVLLKWVMHSYLSDDLLGQSDHPGFDPNKKVDILLYSELVITAKETFLKNVQNEVREQLAKIETCQRGWDKDEAFVGFSIYVIMCIKAQLDAAQKISSEISNRVKGVCFEELLLFLKRYTEKQSEVLREKAKLENPNMEDFLKTLNNCKNLKEYIQTNDTNNQETLATIEKLEDFTQNLLLETASNFAEGYLKNYFKMGSERLLLIEALKALFPTAEIYQDIKKTVMGEVSKIIHHIYLKHLIKRSQRKLQKQWNSDIRGTIFEDAKLLHKVFDELAYGVVQGNKMLLKVAELLDYTDIDTVELIVATMPKDCPTWSMDYPLLPALLRWKGLPRWKVKQVLEVLEELDVIPGNIPRLGSCFPGLCW